jgi:TIR domain/Pentapeptide repeats (8 copies)
MANPEHLAILKQGVEVWNRWRWEHPETLADLVWTNAIDLGLGDNASLIIRPDLWKVDLRMANLSDADLNGVDLRMSDLRGANLRNAILTDALLNSVNLTDANLRGADLTRAAFESTLICHVNLREVKGLEDVQHFGPSAVGIDTIYLSEGQIPEGFLRGCGVPEDFITYMKSLTGKAIELYSCFISYSTKDQDFADRLHEDLQNKRVRCWFAPHDIQGGRKIYEQIDEAIRVYDRLLLILSDDSMSSEWVKTEVANARQREIQEKRQMLFPISLVPYERIKEWKVCDADTGKDSAREIREYFIPDFSNWKDHDSYQQAFQRLLRDLKAEGSDKGA